MITPSSRSYRRARRKLRRDDHAFGLFVVETKAEDGQWYIRSTRRTVRDAQSCAWDLLTRECCAVRIRQGRRVVAEGFRCAPSDDHPSSTG